MSETNFPTIHRKTRVWILLGSATILYFFANFQRSAIPGAIFSDLQNALGVSASKISALGSAFMYVYALNQLVVGLLVDRCGGYRVISFGAFLFCFGALLFPFSDSLSMLYFSRVIVGFGASAVYLSLMKETQRSFPEKFAPVMGFVMLIGYAGGIAANAPFIAGVERIGWRPMLKLAGAAALCVYLFFLLFKFSLRMPAPLPVRFSFRPFLDVLKKRHNRALIFLSSSSFAVYYVYQTVVGKKFLEDFCGMEPLQAGWVLTVTGALSAVSSFLLPLVSGFCGNRRKPFMLLMGIGTFLSCGVCFLSVCLSWRSPAVFAASFCVLSIASNMGPVFLALLGETNSPDAIGVTASFSNCVAYAGVALLGNLTGCLMDLFPPLARGGLLVYGRFSYLAVFAVFTLLAAFSGRQAFLLCETYGENISGRVK